MVSVGEVASLLYKISRFSFSLEEAFSFQGNGFCMALQITLWGCITPTMPLCVLVGGFVSFSWDFGDFNMLLASGGVCASAKGECHCICKGALFHIFIADSVFSKQGGTLLLLGFWFWR